MRIPSPAPHTRLEQLPHLTILQPCSLLIPNLACWMKPGAGWPCWAVVYPYSPSKERTWEAEKMLFLGLWQEEAPKTITAWLRLVQICNWGHTGLVGSPQQSLYFLLPMSSQQSLGEISLSFPQDIASGRYILFHCDMYSKQWENTSLTHSYGKVWHHCHTKRDTAVTIPNSSVLAANLESKLM